MLDALTTARDWGQRPTVILGTASGEGWSEADRLLATARTLDDQARCPCGCGHYRDVTLAADGYHEVATVTCDVRAALDQYDKDHPKRAPGEIRYGYLPDAG